MFWIRTGSLSLRTICIHKYYRIYICIFLRWKIHTFTIKVQAFMWIYFGYCIRNNKYKIIRGEKKGITCMLHIAMHGKMSTVMSIWWGIPYALNSTPNELSGSYLFHTHTHKHTNIYIFLGIFYPFLSLSLDTIFFSSSFRLFCFFYGWERRLL